MKIPFYSLIVVFVEYVIEMEMARMGKAGLNSLLTKYRFKSSDLRQVNYCLKFNESACFQFGQESRLIQTFRKLNQLRLFSQAQYLESYKAIVPLRELRLSPSNYDKRR